MPSTTYKGYEIPATGTLNDTWGTVFNASMIGIVDTNMGGLVSKTMTSSSVTLSAAEARSAMIRLTGTVTDNINLSTPAQGFYMIENLCTDGGGSIILTQGLGLASPVIPFNTRALAFADTANGVRIFGMANGTIPDVVPAGTKMLFVSEAVPSGWTLSEVLDDYALSISDTTGGTASGSLAFSTVFGITATDSHTLTTAEIPSHSHNIVLNSANGGGVDSTAKWSSGTNSFGNLSRDTEETGGDEGHTHNIDMRVQFVTTIMGIRE